MRAIILGVLMMAISASALAQENYAIGLIPKELLPYASAVVRNENVVVEVIDPDDVEYHIKTVTTVLNPNGEEKIDKNIPYDKLVSIKSIKGLIYDEYGKIDKKIAESDFEDYALNDGFSLYRDNRLKHFTRTADHYPYTIELEYVLKLRQSLYFPDWQANPEANVAIQKSSFEFICDPAFNIRYKEFNTPTRVNISTNKDGKKIYAWQVSDVKAWREEPLTPQDNLHEIKVLIAPDQFSYQKYKGSFINWQQLGKWEYDNLLKGRQTLPDETVQYIKSITANIQDPKLKAKKVYEYMQQKTHYISIQVGIGGLQPFIASDVDKDGYGDCKALVNYTKALLQAAGVDSYYCEVYGDVDKLDFISDFPSVQGNHIILCLPFKNDTTWLECTSQQIPFGYLGRFTDDRTVLACTPEGGKLMHTPKYPAAGNLVMRKASFILGETGDAVGNMETTFKGVDYENREAIIEEAQTERLKDFKKYYPINNMFIKKLEYVQDKSLNPATVEHVELTARDYGAVNDGKYYFSLNSFSRLSTALKQVRNRINPVTIARGHTYEDEITYTLPKGYHLDSEPLNVSIDKTFGNFSATMTLKDGLLVYKRKLLIKDGTYDKDLYEDIVDFYDAISDADNYNVTLVKK